MARPGSDGGFGTVECSCGQPLAASDRFCSRCGLEAFARRGGTLNDWDAGPSSLLLTPPDEDEDVRSRSVVQTQPPPWRRLLAGLAVAAVAFWLFQLSRADSDPATEEATARNDESDSTAPAGSSGEAVPTVGQATGFTLVIGSSGSDEAVRVLDLDSGRIRELEGQGGRPVGSVGATVILQSSDRALTSVDLGGPQPVVRTKEDVDLMVVDGDRIWVWEQDQSGSVLTRAYDSRWELVEELDIAAQTFLAGVRPQRIRVSTDLVYNPSGGIYRRTGDGFERLSGGFIEAIGEQVVLTYVCDEQMACRTEWRDKTSWEVLDLFTPTSPGLVHGIVGGDRWLVEEGPAVERVALADIESGAVVRTVAAPFGDLTRSFLNPWSGIEVPVSPDGRWLFERSSQGARIVDLDSGTEWPLQPEVADDAEVLFVALGPVTLFD